MPEATLKAFKAELVSLKDAIKKIPKKTVRDEHLRERFRVLFRSWAGTVKPEVSSFLRSDKSILKLEAELETLANLTSKYKKKSEYQKRINRAINFGIMPFTYP